MSSELNKIFCAILSAILVYLLAAFLSELLYNVDKKKATKLSYNIENVEDKNKDLELLTGLMIEAAYTDGQIDSIELSKIKSSLINVFNDK